MPPTRRRSTARPTFAAGAVVAAVVAIAASFGWLTPLERASVERRFRHAQFARQADSDLVRFCDIDDGALESIGRWPWPRSTLAAAIHELGNAGAAVIALDLLFDEPQAPEWVAHDRAALSEMPAVRLVDHDAALAEAIEAHDVLLAVSAPAPPPFADEESTDLIVALVEAFSRDPSLEAEHALDQLDTPAHLRERVMATPVLYRRLAALLGAARLTRKLGHIPNSEEFRQALSGAVGDYFVSFADERRAARAFDALRAAHAVERTLAPEKSARESVGRIETVEDAVALTACDYPAPALAESARRFGAVNFDSIADGLTLSVRSSRPLATGSSLPQFGLAAAAHFAARHGAENGAHASRIEALSNQPDILLAWPRPGSGVGAHDRRISLGAVASMAQSRETLDRMRSDRVRLARHIAGATLDAPENDADAIALARDLAAQRVAERDEILAEGATLSPDEEEYLAPFVNFADLDSAIATGEAALDDAESTLRGHVDGRIVFVGWNATGALADFVRTPLASRTPGVTVHGVVADMALTGRTKRLLPPWTAPLLALALGASLAALPALVSPARAAAAAISLLLAYLGVGGVLLFDAQHIVAPLAAPMLAGALAWAASTAAAAAFSAQEKAQIRRQFSARVSPQLVDRLASDPDALAVAGQQREITTLFLDIAGFTSLSENLGGAETVAILNDAMRGFTHALIERNAYVNKFLGDGLMAFWSAFEEDPRQAERAIDATIACRDALRDINDRLGLTGTSRLRARMGVATGLAIVGDCGAPPALNDYTAIGNSVNLAARLESASKQLGADILIDGRTVSLAPGAPSLRRLGRIIVVGQTEPVDVFEIPGAADPEAVALQDEAIRAFAGSRLDDAQRAIDAHDERFGASPLTRTYRDAIAIAREDPDPSCAGVLRLRSK